MRRQATSSLKHCRGLRRHRTAPPMFANLNATRFRQHTRQVILSPVKLPTRNLQFGKEALRGRTGDEQMPEQIRHHRDADDDVARSDVTTLSGEARASNCGGTAGCKSDELAIAVIGNYNSDTS